MAFNLSGLAGALSPALTVGTQAAGAKAQADLSVAERERSQMLQAALLARQVQNESIQNALRQAQTAKALHENAAPVLGEPGYATARGDVAGAEAGAQVAPHVAQAIQTETGTAPIKTQQAIAQARGIAPIEENKAVNIASRTAPIDIAKAGAEAQARLPAELQVAATRAGFTPRAQNARAALPQIQSAAQVLSKYNTPGAAGRLFGRSSLGGYVMSPEGHIANQAADQFVTAYLGARSIRNPTPATIAEYKKQIQVQPGEENNQTVIDKKQLRIQQMQEEVNNLGVDASLGAIGSGVHDIVGKYGITPSKP